MKRTAILASAGAVALGLSCTVCGELAVAHESNANSSGFTKSLDLNKLPDASKPFQARRKIQIVRETPEVTDCTGEEAPRKVIIQLPPRTPVQEEVTVIRMPGASSAGTTSDGGPGTVTLDLSRPPRSRFGSNIPSGGMAPSAALPNGTTTNRLAGANANARGRLNPQSVPIRKGDLLRTTNTKPASSAPQTTLMYPTSNGSGTGSSSIGKKVTTNVSGKVNKRGDYLKPPH